MTGIRERRMWPDGTRPSDASAAAGRAVLGVSALRREDIGLFIHAAVSRDMLEPASASFAHRKIGLPASAQIFDVSNACLGFLNSIVVAAGADRERPDPLRRSIVAGENGRPLVEETVRTLLAGSLDRNAIKPFFANLTIGCGAVAAVVCHSDLAKGRATPDPGRRLPLGDRAQRALPGRHRGRRGPRDADGLRAPAGGRGRPGEGDLGAISRRRPAGRRATVDRAICHQVGSAHRRRLFETLGLDLAKDFSTFETLGNMGSVSLPATLSAAVDAGAIKDGDKVALMGIGSGLNCLMLALEW